MKNIFRTAMLFVVAFIFISEAQAQQPKKPRASLNASVSQTIGIDTEISINYSRPGVKGRKIWGDIVPFGYSPGNKYSNEKPFPWRGGANENTTISFSKDVLIEGNKVPAGKYSLHFIPSENDWVVIINKNNTLWGSYLVNPDEDALRVTVKTSKAHFQEWLLYGFDNLSATSATAFLHWEELKVPFNISVVE